MAIPLTSNFQRGSAIPLDEYSVRADLTARDAIPLAARYEFMECVVAADGGKYRLEGGLDNGHWVAMAQASAGGGAPSFIASLNSNTTYSGGGGDFSDFAATTLKTSTDAAWSDSGQNLALASAGFYKITVYAGFFYDLSVGFVLSAPASGGTRVDEAIGGFNASSYDFLTLTVSQNGLEQVAYWCDEFIVDTTTAPSLPATATIRLNYKNPYAYEGGFGYFKALVIAQKLA